MKIARVVGNVVSTVKDESFIAKKLVIIEWLDDKLQKKGARIIAFDAAGAGAGDIVLVNAEGDAAKLMLGDETMIGDLTVCGVIDSITIDKRTVKTT
ncbi:MAG: EutN/CcmL family microcompartment protein [Christensenella sp.]|uniref:EutN/CcmL family microcompartment protein n=1 Tax=Christensenella sp. TaxID=1935934 RepID=UPI002B215C43|nr:EutN/CcmL family microcompartment protein [Christensenella sp.]MEA5001915.1 EutN/CcmL family microcompartment protein [Christensenella sp.]